MSSREIGPRSAYRTPGQDVAAAILGAADAIRRRFARVVEPHGITVQQYNVLRILRRAHPAPLATLEIGERLLERAPGITRLLDRLEEKGLVRRERSADDRRLVHCRIAPRGLQLLAALDDDLDFADEAAAQSLDEGEVSELVEMLQRVARGLDK